jgi:hypothetical protein
MKGYSDAPPSIISARRQLRRDMKRMEREIARHFAGRTPSEAEYEAAWAAELARYGDRPHPHLPKVRDQATGRLRHQTPNEASAARGGRPGATYISTTMKASTPVMPAKPAGCGGQTVH